MSHFDRRFRIDDASNATSRCRRWASLLQHDGPSFDDDVEIIARFALFDDRLAVFEWTGFQSVGHCVPFPLLQALCKRTAAGARMKVKRKKQTHRIKHQLPNNGTIIRVHINRQSNDSSIYGARTACPFLYLVHEPMKEKINWINGFRLTQNGDFGKEFFVHLALAYCRSHQDAAVRITIQSPQFDVRFGCPYSSNGPE